MQTRREYDRTAEASLPRESFGELLGQLANNSAALVRDEIELARQEMSEKATALRSGLVVLAVGSLIALVAILTLTAAAVIGLAHYVGAGNSALIIGAALGVIGAATTLAGLGQIRRTNLKPEQTIETLEEDKEWLKELT
jgi:uncharacterized membrane protein YqjE